jgi:hypothetical protein
LGRAAALGSALLVLELCSCARKTERARETESEQDREKQSEHSGFFKLA